MASNKFIKIFDNNEIKKDDFNDLIKNLESKNSLDINYLDLNFRLI